MLNINCLNAGVAVSKIINNSFEKVLDVVDTIIFGLFYMYNS